MIRISSALSGEPIAVNIEEFKGISGEHGEPSAANVKKYLAAKTGFSRFRQKLFLEDAEIDGDAVSVSDDLKLLIVEHLPPDAEQDEKLVLACIDNNVSEVEKLLCEPRNPDTKRPDGRTPLHFAAEKGSLESARLLIEAGAVKDMKANGKMPLHWAASNGHAETVRFLIESGAQKDVSDSFGATPLHLAAKKGRHEVVRLLLDFGAEKDQTTNDGRSPLHLAAEFGRLEAVRILLAAGAEKDKATADEHSLTPLHWAAYSGHLEVVRILLEAGCDAEKTTKPFDETPSQLALSVGHAEVACLLDQWKWGIWWNSLRSMRNCANPSCIKIQDHVA